MAYTVYGANDLSIFEPQEFLTFTEAFQYAKRISKNRKANVHVNGEPKWKVIATYKNGELTYLNKDAK